MEQKGNDKNTDLDAGFEVVGEDAPSRESIYNDIKLGLRNNQVGYTTAVRAFEVALESLDDAETRDFLNTFFKRVVDVLLDQFPNAYKRQIERSMHLATRIIVQLIKLHGEPVQMAAFETLALVFDKSKNFYCGQRTVYRVAPGAPEVHADCIKIFNEYDGFESVLGALQEREWPGADKIRVLLDMCEYAGNNESVVQMAYTIMEKSRTLTPEALKKEDMDQMQKMVVNINRILKSYEPKDKHVPHTGFNFWLELNSMYLKCGSLPQRLHAVEQVRPMNQHARRMRKPPFGFRVEGCGLRYVNGVYHREGFHKNAPMWKHTVENPEGDEPDVVTMFRCEMRSSQKYWFLSKADEGSPGTDKDIDYYNAKSGDQLPPMTGWKEIKKGKGPSPTLIEIRDESETEEERNNSLEQSMLKWIREVGLIQDIFGDRIHKEVVSRSESVFQFLVDMNSMTMEDLAFVWQRSLEVDEELGAAVTSLLASVCKYMPAKLLKSFLKMVGVASKDNYASALLFARKLASGGANVRVLLGKGQDATSAILEFLWSLLHNPNSFRSATEQDILDLLEEALRTNEGIRFRTAYVAQCIQNIQKSLNPPTDEDVEEREDALIRDFTIMLRLVSGYVEGNECSALRKLWEDKGTQLKVLLPRELKALKDRSVNLSPFKYQNCLRKRLDLIRGLNGKISGPRLSSDEIQQFWDLLSSEIEREVFIAWVSGASKDVERMDPAFNEDVRSFVFEKLICDQLSKFPGASGKDSYGCFENLFLQVNTASRKLLTSVSSNHEVLDLNLVGIDVLWKLALQGSKDCYENALKLLLDLYKYARTDVGKSEEQFLERAFEKLDDSNANARRCIMLLEKFVEKYKHGEALPHELRGRGNRLMLTIQVKKISNSMRNNQWSSTTHPQHVDLPKYEHMCHTKMSVGTLTQILAKEHKHPKKRIKIFDRSSSMGHKTLTDPSKTLAEEGICSGGELMVMLYSVQNTSVYGTSVSNNYEQEDEVSPGGIIASSIKYSEALFKLLSETKDTALRNDVWNFLQKLPTQEKILRAVGGPVYHEELVGTSESRWSALLVGQPLYRSIYCLQVIDSYLIPSNPKEPSVLKWREDFVASKGFQRVLDLFKIGTMPAVGYAASIRILQYCLLGFRDGNEFTEDTKDVVLKEINFDELMDQMIKVIVSCLKPSTTATTEYCFSAANNNKLLVDTLKILQYIVREKTRHSLIEKLFASNQMSFLVKDVIIGYKSQRVRRWGAELIGEIAGAEDMLPRLFELLFSARTHVSPDCGTCTQYFNLISKLIPKFTNEMINKLVKYSVGVLQEYPRNESPQLSDYEYNRSSDEGYLYSFSANSMKLLANILDKRPNAYKNIKEVAPDFADSVYSRFLFSVPSMENRKAWPLCRLPQTRGAAFSLLTALVKADQSALVSVAAHARNFKASVRTDKIGWYHEPDWNKKEIRYVGLKNQGCTCYMNAVLQQLYLIKEIREGVLGAPPPALQNENQREKIDLTSIDLQSLVGKKVDLQWHSKRWYSGTVTNYDPETGAHTLKYSDGEVAEVKLSEGRPPSRELPSAVAFQPGPPSKEDAAANVLRQTQNVFRFLKDSEMRYYDPKQFVESCQALGMEYGPYQQNDSDEFLTKLLDKVEFAMKGGQDKRKPKTLRWLKDCFGGHFVAQKIPKCNKMHRRERKEAMICIKLAVPKMAKLEDGLTTYVKEEVLDGDNKVECDACKEEMTANNDQESIEKKLYKKATVKRDCFGELPNVLVVALNRFELDYETFETVKRNDRVEFPMVLNMEPYTKEFIEAREAEEEARQSGANENDGEDMGDNDSESRGAPTRLIRATSEDMTGENGKYAYRLRGVVIHSGIAQGGHYYSLGRVPDNEDDGGDGKWYKFDDDKVTPFPVDKIGDECFGGYETRKVRRQEWNSNSIMHEQEIERMHNALLLFYERIIPQASEDAHAYNEEFEDGGESGAVVPAVENTSEYQVWDANSSYFKSSYLFDKNYSKFLLEMCVHSPTEESSSYTPPMKGALVTNGESLASTGIRHLLDVVFRTRDKQKAVVWGQTMRRHLSKNVEGASWFLTCLINGEWLREVMLDCLEKESREILASLVRTAVKTLVPYESSNKDTYTGALADGMVSLIKPAAKSWEQFDEFFLLFRDLAVIPHLRERLVGQKVVSQLINVFMNKNSPSEITRIYGAIPYLGNHHNQPNFQSILDTIAVLMGVLVTPRDTVLIDNTVPKSEAVLTEAARNVFSNLFDKFAPSGEMSIDDFIDFCVACGAGGVNNLRSKIKPEKVEDIFSKQKRAPNGNLPKESFLNFYKEATYDSHSTVWRDLQHHKFSDDLLHQGPVVSDECGTVNVEETLPELCSQVIRWSAFQQKLLAESSKCRMAVPMLLSSCGNNADSSFELINVALHMLENNQGEVDLRGAVDGTVNILRPLIDLDDGNQEKRLELIFVGKDIGLFLQAKHRSSYIGTYPSTNRGSKSTFSFIKIVASLAMGSAAAKQWLSKHKPNWKWMVNYAKEVTLQIDLGGSRKSRKRLPENIEVIDVLAQLQGMPTVEDDLQQVKKGTVVVAGAGNSVVDGVYRFDGYFNQVPKYSMTVKFGSEGPDGGVSTKKFTIFKCKLANGQSQWYLSILHPQSPGTDKDIDYYQVKSSSNVPPLENWKNCGKGVLPAPEIKLQDIEEQVELDVGPSSPQAHSSNPQPPDYENPGSDDDLSYDAGAYPAPPA